MTLLLDTRVGHARLVVTTRAGGCSAAPYDSANLSLGVGDDPDRVLANRAALAGRLGLAPQSLLFLHQVHGDRVLEPDEVSDALAPGAAVLDADAAVLATPGAGVAVTAADCLPLLLADRTTGSWLTAAAHVGRRGLAAGIATRCLERFVAAGAADPVAVLGPAIGACCYEVGTQLRDEVEAAAPGAAATTRSGTAALDIRRAVRNQLATAGLSPAAISDVARCTAEDARLYSYRRDPVSGRFAGVVALPDDMAARR